MTSTTPACSKRSAKPRIEGASEQAAASFAEALHAFADIGDEAGIPECLDGLALVGPEPLQEQSQLRLLSTADAVRARFQRPFTRPDRVPTTLRIAAGRVQPMELADAVALALDQLKSP
jgi:hypothetical protein